MVSGSDVLNSEIFQNEELKLDMDLTSSEESAINKLNSALTDLSHKENEDDEEEKLVTKTDIIDVAKTTKIKIDVDMLEDDDEKYEEKTLEEILADVNKYLDHEGSTWKVKTKSDIDDIPAYILHISENEAGARDIAYLIQTFGKVMLSDTVERGYASKNGSTVSRDKIFGGQTMNVAKKSLGAVEHEEGDISKVIESGLDALDAEVDQLSHKKFEDAIANRRVERSIQSDTLDNILQGDLDEATIDSAFATISSNLTGTGRISGYTRVLGQVQTHLDNPDTEQDQDLSSALFAYAYKKVYEVLDSYISKKQEEEGFEYSLAEKEFFLSMYDQIYNMHELSAGLYIPNIGEGDEENILSYLDAIVIQYGWSEEVETTNTDKRQIQLKDGRSVWVSASLLSLVEANKSREISMANITNANEMQYAIEGLYNEEKDTSNLSSVDFCTLNKEAQDLIYQFNGPGSLLIGFHRPKLSTVGDFSNFSPQIYPGFSGTMDLGTWKNYIASGLGRVTPSDFEIDTGKKTYKISIIKEKGFHISVGNEDIQICENSDEVHRYLEYFDTCADYESVAKQVATSVHQAESLISEGKDWEGYKFEYNTNRSQLGRRNNGTYTPYTGSMNDRVGIGIDGFAAKNIGLVVEDAFGKHGITYENRNSFLKLVNSYSYEK